MNEKVMMLLISTHIIAVRSFLVHLKMVLALVLALVLAIQCVAIPTL